MALILTFLVNAALNLVLGLAVAKFLGPQAFGQYAVAMAVAVVLNAVGFEWLRLSATRFYSERTRRDDPGLRATLDAGYAAVAIGLALLMALAWLTGLDLGMPTALLAAATAAAIGMGLFDYQAALARARFLERSYLRLVLLKNAAAFGLMVGGAALFGDPRLVLAGAALSAGAATLVAWRSLSDGGVGRTPAERRRLGRFAAYAAPLVAASVVYQLIPLINRGVLAARDGYAEAGQFSLSADLGLRVFTTLGSALDILLFQLAVRTDASHGRAEAERQVGRNIALVVALLLPFAAGLWLILPALETLVVPSAYRGPFARYAGVLIPGFFALALIQYALNPIFQLRQQTAPVVIAALVALCVDGLLVTALPPLIGATGVAVAQIAGFAAAAAVVTVLALKGGGVALPWRDIGLSAAATVAMIAALMPLRDQTHILALAGSVALGIAVYGGFVYAFDIANLRSLAGARFGRRAAAAPAE